MFIKRYNGSWRRKSSVWLLPVNQMCHFLFYNTPITLSNILYLIGTVSFKGPILCKIHFQGFYYPYWLEGGQWESSKYQKNSHAADFLTQSILWNMLLKRHISYPPRMMSFRITLSAPTSRYQSSLQTHHPCSQSPSPSPSPPPPLHTKLDTKETCCWASSLLAYKVGCM